MARGQAKIAIVSKKASKKWDQYKKDHPNGTKTWCDIRKEEWALYRKEHPNKTDKKKPTKKKTTKKPKK